MEIKIIRFGRYHHAVSGRLLIDGQHVCDTLEQDTGSLPEGEYVMCRNKASALPYYIYRGLAPIINHSLLSGCKVITLFVNSCKNLLYISVFYEIFRNSSISESFLMMPSGMDSSTFFSSHCNPLIQRVWQPSL